MRIRPGSIIRRPSLPLLLSVFLTGCTIGGPDLPAGTLNSRRDEKQPALSGDGRWLAFVSDRQGPNRIYLYDLLEKHYENLPGLYAGEGITDSPSLSRTARYLVYLVTVEGRPVIALYDRPIRRSQLLAGNYRGAIREPSVSPDGRYVVFQAARNGQWDIEVLDRGSNIELDIADGTPVESPNP